ERAAVLILFVVIPFEELLATVVFVELNDFLFFTESLLPFLFLLLLLLFLLITLLITLLLLSLSSSILICWMMDNDGEVGEVGEEVVYVVWESVDREGVSGCDFKLCELGKGLPLLFRRLLLFFDSTASEEFDVLVMISVVVVLYDDEDGAVDIALGLQQLLLLSSWLGEY